jgi:hypothetical protein
MTRNLQYITASAAAVAALATCAASAAPGRGDRLPIGSEPVTLDPATFSTTIDNPYLPMTPGDRRVHRKTSVAGRVKRVVEVVTNQTRLVAGIEARVVHVVDYVDGSSRRRRSTGTRRTRHRQRPPSAITGMRG